jgi:hypothetical protein
VFPEGHAALIKFPGGSGDVVRLHTCGCVGGDRAQSGTVGTMDREL